MHYLAELKKLANFFYVGKKLLFFALAFSIFLSQASSAKAATFYVSTTSDGSGTVNNISDPYNSVRNAVIGAFNHADTSSTVLVRGGTYNQSENIFQRDFVTAGKTVTIKPYPAETATFKPVAYTGANADYAWRFVGPSSGISIDGDADGGQIILDGENMLATQLSDNTTAGARDLNDKGLLQFTGNTFTANGLIIRNSHGRGIQFTNVTNITISYNTVYNIKTRAIGGSGVNITIDNNTVYNAVLENTDQAYNQDGVGSNDPDEASGSDGCGGWAGAISTVKVDTSTPSTYVTISNNTVYDNWGEGIIPFDSRYVEILNNTVYNNYSVNLYVEAVQDAVVNGNYVYQDTGIKLRDQNADCPDEPSRYTYGISIANEIPDTGSVAHTENMVITNNLVFGCEASLRYWFDSSNTESTNTYTNLTVAHNIFWEPVSDVFLIGCVYRKANGTDCTDHALEPTAPSNAHFRNNVVSRGSASYGTVNDPSAWTFSHNHWVEGEPSFTNITHTSSTTGDPEFVGPTNELGDPATYFKITGNSPLASAGTSTDGLIPLSIDIWSPETYISDDYFGNNYDAETPSKGLHEPNLAPTVTIDTPATDQVINVGASVSFTSTASDPENGTITYVWDFDGAGISNDTNADPGSKTFNTPGVFTVSVTATDDSSNNATDSAIITTRTTATPQDFETPVQQFNVSAATLTSMSGQTTSFNSGYSWVINEGAQDTIYLMNNTTGAIAKSYTLSVTATDTEDLARGPKAGGGNYIYIADTGCNSSCGSKQGKIYRVTEPEPSTLDGGSGGSLTVETITFTYPHFYPDTEVLMVNPRASASSDIMFIMVGKSLGDYMFGTDGSGNGDGKKYAYYFTKATADAAWDGSAIQLTKSSSQIPLLSDTAAGTYTVDSSQSTYDIEFTAGDVSADGRHIAIRSVDDIFYWTVTDGTNLADTITSAPDVIKEWTGGDSYETLTFNTAVDGFYTAKKFSFIKMQYFEFSDNTPPSVNAGTDQSVNIDDGANLDATVSDDGLPASPGALTYTWSKYSGGGSVTFGNANAVDTTAEFSAAGSYVLRLSVTDGSLTVTDDITITVAASLGPDPTPTPTPIPDNGSVKKPEDDANRKMGDSIVQLCSNNAPSTPAHLFEVSTTKDSATLYFSPANGSDNHTIFYGLGNNVDMYNTKVTTGTARGVIIHTIHGLTPDTEYSFSVRAEFGCALASNSNKMKIKAIENGKFYFDQDATMPIPRSYSISDDPKITEAKNNEEVLGETTTASTKPKEKNSAQNSQANQTEKKSLLQSMNNPALLIIGFSSLFGISAFMLYLNKE